MHIAGKLILNENRTSLKPCQPASHIREGNKLVVNKVATAKLKEARAMLCKFVDQKNEEARKASSSTPLTT